MNYSNLAQKPNFTAGSETFPNLLLYLTSVSIPGINFNHTELGGRDGARLNVSGDTLTFNSLSFEMLIDEDFMIYHEFMDEIMKTVNVKNGTFSDSDFPFWVQIYNSKGNSLFRVDFNNCRIESIGAIELATQDDTTEYTIPVEIKYDYHTIERGDTAPILRV